MKLRNGFFRKIIPCMICAALALLAFMFVFSEMAAGENTSKVDQEEDKTVPKKVSVYDQNPVTIDASAMTDQELQIEMRYAMSLKDKGVYYPETRMNRLVSEAMARSQTQLIKEKEDQERAVQRVEAAKTFIDNAVKKYNEITKPETGTNFNEFADKLLEASNLDGTPLQGINEIKELDALAKDSSVYKGYDLVTTACDTTKAYLDGKNAVPYAPGSAQDLMGAMNALVKMIESGAGLIEDTPLYGHAKLLESYAKACESGVDAGKVAWNAAHKDGLNDMYGSKFQDALNEAYKGEAVTLMETSSLTNYNPNHIIMRDHNGDYAAFNKKGELMGKMTQSEYETAEVYLAAYEQGRGKSWAKTLTTEQLLQVSKGENIKVVTKDGFFKDEVTELSPKDIINHANHAKYMDQLDIGLNDIDQILTGKKSWLGNALDFGKDGRKKELELAFNQYKRDVLNKLDGSYLDKSLTGHLEDFKNEIEQLAREGKSWDEIKSSMGIYLKDDEETGNFSDYKNNAKP